MPSAADFERLALPHMDAAFTLAYWLVQSRADAEDVVQEAMLRAFKAFADVTGAEIRPWLLAIVRNAAYRALEQRKRSARIVSLEAAIGTKGSGPATALDVPSDEQSAEAVLLGRIDARHLSEALLALPPAFRETVVLREIEGCSYREIAAITGVPVGTVMSRLSRARLELREAICRARAKDDGNAV